tara:strand:- start:42 stop:236 length:195 start_codon:yes stop_codon:yes gene_type:complete
MDNRDFNITAENIDQNHEMAYAAYLSWCDGEKRLAIRQLIESGLSILDAKKIVANFSYSAIPRA